MEGIKTIIWIKEYEGNNKIIFDSLRPKFSKEFSFYGKKLS